MATLAHLFEYRRDHLMRPIQQWMQQRGLQFIDSGAMSATFRNKSGEIVKVIDDDPCYRAFVALVHRNSGNPHFPRLRRLARFEHPVLKNTFMLKLEPLEPLTVFDWHGNIGLHCYIIIEHNMFNHGNRAMFVDTLPRHTIKQALGGDPMRDSQALAEARRLANEFQRTDPEFVKALNLVMFGKDAKCRMDMHSGNFMKRGSTWVITDPYIEL